MPQASKKGMKINMPVGNLAPQLRLTSDQFADIKDWKVGETYTLEVVVKAVAKNEGQEYSFDTANKGLVRMTFDVKSVKEDTPAEDQAEK